MSMFTDVINDLKKLDQSPPVMRKFGIVLGILLGLLGGLIAYKHSQDATIFTGSVITFWSLAVLSFLMAVACPALLKPLNTGMVIIGMMIGWVMTRIILGIMFYLIITPMGWLMKLIGKDQLGLKIDRSAATYWIHRPPTPFDRDRCKRLF